MGVLRRRHLLTRHGREVIGLDDEVFDPDAVEAAGPHGRSARARCSRRSSGNRTGRMADIVATIQAEQDAAVRADLPGVLVVAGGPGHRQDRGRAAPRRVPPLHVPAPAREPGRAARRPEHRVPALHRAGAPVARRARGAARDGQRAEAAARRAPTSTRRRVAAVKGDARMATVLRRALGDRERPPRADVEIAIDGLRLRLIAARLPPRRSSGCSAGRATHNAHRPLVERMLLDRLVAQYRAALARTHREVLDLDDLRTDEDGGLRPAGRGRARRGARRRRASGSASSPAGCAATPRCASCSSGCGRCSPAPSSCTTCSASRRSSAPRPTACSRREEQRLLFRPRSASRARRAVDRSRRRARRRGRRAARPGRGGAAAPRRPAVGADREAVEAARERGAGARARRLHDRGRRWPSATATAPAAADDAIPELRTFGHVLVDEAQDLTPMQWRMLARRCPTGSMTIVGDFGQASRPGAATSWDEVLEHLPEPRRAAPGHAHGQLPHAGRDHGPRQPAARGRGARASSRPSRCAAPGSRRGSPGSTDLVAGRRRRGPGRARARAGPSRSSRRVDLHAAITDVARRRRRGRRRGRGARRADRRARSRPTPRASSSTT